MAPDAMALDPATPVLVGVGVVQQREADPREAAEPIELMARALERAAQDAGSRALLERADWIRVPRGFWDYPDPGRWLAHRLGAAGARSEVAEIGVLQTTLLGRAAAEIAAGRSQVSLVTGGEARYRRQSAARAGVEAPLTRQAVGTPDSVLRPDGEILSAHELAAGLHMPVGSYAMLENALRAAEKQRIAEHRQAVAGLWARMSRVAAGNPDAWSARAYEAAEIRDAGPDNRMLAFPYTRLHNSQWNVDQAAGLVLCSVAVARSLGVPRERWVFPLAVADSNHMLPFSARRDLHRSAGFAHAGARVLERCGLGVGEIDHLELYSCFPVAVRVQARELGIDETRPLSVTGGMAFAGGPLNNFVLQALARMARVLRSDPGSRGLLTAVSGILTKQGVSLWSTQAPRSGFHFDDVSNQAERDTQQVEVVARAEGPASIASYSVLHDVPAPRALLLCDLPDGRRTLASSRAPELVLAGGREELCGRGVVLSEGDVRLA